MDNLSYQVLNKINAGIVVVDRDQRIVIWSHWLERYTKKTKQEVINRKIGEVCPKFQDSLYQEILDNALLHGIRRFCSGALHRTFFIAAAEGRSAELIRQNMLVEPICLDEGAFALIQITDITSQNNRVNKLKSFIKEMEAEYEEIKESEKANKQLALYDPLTGLPNRILFMDRLLWAINYAQRNNEIFFVMFLDLDGFKMINDTYGHETGDILLKAVAQRLLSLVRKTDTVARLSGDEFILLLPQAKVSEDACSIAKKIIGGLDMPFEINDASVTIGVSIGITLYPKDGTDPRTLIKKADMAMYEVKRSGKNNFKQFS